MWGVVCHCSGMGPLNECERVVMFSYQGWETSDALAIRWRYSLLFQQRKQITPWFSEFPAIAVIPGFLLVLLYSLVGGGWHPSKVALQQLSA